MKNGIHSGKPKKPNLQKKYLMQIEEHMNASKRAYAVPGAPTHLDVMVLHLYIMLLALRCYATALRYYTDKSITSAIFGRIWRN